jgi:pimeloyl-ACP methyl ester carboxylesterase
VIVPSRNSKRLDARIANSRLVLYDGAAHGFLFHNRLAMARRINAFLA